MGEFLAGVALTLFVGFLVYKVRESRKSKSSGGTGGGGGGGRTEPGNTHLN